MCVPYVTGMFIIIYVEQIKYGYFNKLVQSVSYFSIDWTPLL